MLSCCKSKKDIRIVIGQRGWVFVGEYTEDAKEQCICLDNASVIRIWGTTKGIGQLAMSGPTEHTKLDPCGRVAMHVLAAVAVISCNADKWA
jgi:exosome complex RNA-binding protein Rrp4